MNNLQPGRQIQMRCITALILAALLLSGCGFKMRGSASLPDEMAVTYIKSRNPHDSLVTDFTDALRVRDVEVTEDREASTATLVIMDNRSDKDVLSVNRNGKVLEYQLTQSIQFAVETKDKEQLLEPQQVSMSRDFLYNSNDVLSKQREEAVVRRTLQRELVNLAILRMSAVAN